MSNSNTQDINENSTASPDTPKIGGKKKTSAKKSKLSAKKTRTSASKSGSTSKKNKTTVKKPPSQKKRQDHPAEIKAEIYDRYRFHHRDDEKDWLCHDYGIVDEEGNPVRTKLYNLTSRMGGTRARREAQMRSLTPEKQRELKEKRLKKLSERVEFSLDIFSEWDDKFLKRHFGKFKPEEFSIARRLPESAILYRARQLGLRRTPVLWEVESVKAWLGIDEEALQGLADILEIFAFKPARDGLIRRRVTTKSLVKLINLEGEEGAIDRWVERGADGFFVREIVESGQSSGSEACIWLDGGHSCSNTDAGAACDTFCSTNDIHEAGKDPVCEENGTRNLPISQVSIGKMIASGTISSDDKDLGKSEDDS